MTPAGRLSLRQRRATPLWDELQLWMRLERTRVTDGSGIAAALDYSLRRWEALGCYLRDGEVSIDNNHIENQMRPWAMGRNKANSAFMRSPPDEVVTGRRAGPPQSTDNASHNYSPCRKANRAFGARYRACLTSGCLRRANARSFIARSASTYM